VATFTADIGAPTAAGYHLEVRCACGEAFQRWISPAIAAANLIHSRLLTAEN
jgi:hypothetical protein